MTKTVFAHTPAGATFPPYVNLSRKESGIYALTVRSKGNGGLDLGAIELSPEAVEALATAALAELHREPAAGMNFGQALEAIKAGQRIARTGWNGKGMFVYLVPPASYPVQTGAAKAHFGEGAMVPYNAYMAIKNVDGTVSTWVPSVNDCLATDWGTVGESAMSAQPASAAAITLPVVDPGPDSLEREIQAKANNGPRVTPAALEDEIVSAHYFTASDGVVGATAALTGQALVGVTCEVPPLHLLTFCVLVLRNGFTVVGHSACASPENFNAEIGRRIARENAEREIWPLLGFRLRDQLSAA